MPTDTSAPEGKPPAPEGKPQAQPAYAEPAQAEPAQPGSFLCPLDFIFPFMLYLAVKDDFTGLETVTVPIVVTAMCILGCVRFSMLTEQIRSSKALAPSVTRPASDDKLLQIPFITEVKHLLVEAQFVGLLVLLFFRIHRLAFYPSSGTTSTLVTCSYFVSLTPVVLLFQYCCPFIWYRLHTNAMTGFLLMLLSFPSNYYATLAKEQAVSCAHACELYRDDNPMDVPMHTCLKMCAPARSGSPLCLFAVVVITCLVAAVLEHTKCIPPLRRPAQEGAVHDFVTKASLPAVICAVSGMAIFNLMAITDHYMH
jgi:hypothetical protein